VYGNTTDEQDILTEYGRKQAERLGKEWRDVRIDVLHASTLQRAHATALQIAKHNHNTTLEVIADDRYVERKMGQAVIDAINAGRIERASDLYTGLSHGSSGVTPRDYQPPGGGESPNNVAARATLSLLTLLLTYGKALDEPPREFVDKTVIDSPNVLPEGIPHVVVVSHNIFLAELYESMFSWAKDHRMTTCDYRNAEW
jgi:broad specificity phosphatase PhoE